jgi:hypothetical protein
MEEKMNKSIIPVSDNTENVWAVWRELTVESLWWNEGRKVVLGHEDALKAALQSLEEEFNEKSQGHNPSWELQKELNNIYSLIGAIKRSLSK